MVRCAKHDFWKRQHGALLLLQYDLSVEVTKAGKEPGRRAAVRLTACLEAAGVKSKTRGARVYVDDICHDALTIVI
jgi:hypothetical protein